MHVIYSKSVKSFSKIKFFSESQPKPNKQWHKPEWTLHERCRAGCEGMKWHGITTFYIIKALVVSQIIRKILIFNFSFIQKSCIRSPFSFFFIMSSSEKCVCHTEIEIWKDFCFVLFFFFIFSLWQHFDVVSFIVAWAEIFPKISCVLCVCVHVML